jgi:hypothetical protein
VRRGVHDRLHRRRSYVKVFHEGSGPARHLGKKTEAVAVMARQIAPKRSGFLAANIYVSRNRNELGRFTFGYKVYTPVFYGGFVHEGTGPSPRWPVNNKVMRFGGSDGPVYRDFVMHPGTPANPFLQNALVAMAN